MATSMFDELEELEEASRRAEADLSQSVPRTPCISRALHSIY